VKDAPIREVARQIGHELPALLGQDEGAAVRRELDGLLAEAEKGEEVDDRLLALLAAREATRVRADELLPASLEEGERGFEPLPGYPSEPPGLAVYGCPEGDYDWPQFEAGEPVPDCPLHGIPLVRVGSEE
jgi:hypothetical protein